MNDDLRLVVTRVLHKLDIIERAVLDGRELDALTQIERTRTSVCAMAAAAEGETTTVPSW